MVKDKKSNRMFETYEVSKADLFKQIHGHLYRFDMNYIIMELLVV